MIKVQRTWGFALISVMALMTILIILLGALLGTNRTAFDLLRFTQSKDRIDRTVSSVYSYCRFRLEHDFAGGKEPFESDRELAWSQLKVKENKHKTGEGWVRTLTGEDTENLTRFKVRLVNNLRRDGEVAVLADLVPENERKGVPVGFCRIEIAVEADGRLDGVEIMARNPGLVGAVCLSSDDLDLQARSLAMLTRDPIKNQARSDKSTLITGMEEFLRGRTAETKSPGKFSDRDPVFWSGENALFRGGPNGNYQSRRQFKATHPEFKDERFFDESEAIFGLPPFGVGDLAEVKAASGQPKDVKKISPGVYRFEQYGWGNGRVRVMTVRDLGPSGDPGRADGNIRAFYYMNEGSSATTGEVARLVGASAAQGTEYVAPPEDAILGPDGAQGQGDPMKRYVTINDDGGAYADLRNRRLVFDEKVNFEVDGPLGIIGSAPITEQNPRGDDDKRQVNPAIYFGAPEDIAQTENYAVEGAATVAARSPEKGSLKTRGPLTIQGDISGSTTLAAEGDVTIQPNRFFDPKGNSDVNFSVFSEGNVKILPPPIHEDAEDRNVSNDGDVYVGYDAEQGVYDKGINVSEKDLKFTGLLYAQKSVEINLQDTIDDPAIKNHRNLIIEGAVVARTGGISVVNADHLELVYNPQFVDQLLPEVAQRGRRIEVTGWRNTKPSSVDFASN